MQYRFHINAILFFVTYIRINNGMGTALFSIFLYPLTYFHMLKRKKKKKSSLIETVYKNIPIKLTFSPSFLNPCSLTFKMGYKSLQTNTELCPFRRAVGKAAAEWDVERPRGLVEQERGAHRRGQLLHHRQQRPSQSAGVFSALRCRCKCALFLSISLWFCLAVWLSCLVLSCLAVCLSINISAYLPIYLSILSTYLFIQVSNSPEQRNFRYSTLLCPLPSTYKENNSSPSSLNKLLATGMQKLYFRHKTATGTSDN